MIILGTRGSDLALWQARHVQSLLQERAGLAVRIRVIRTVGDRVVDRSLSSLDGQGFFTREIEESLLSGEIDLAVHSYKDLPTVPVSGLEVAAVPERGSAADCLLIRPEAFTGERGWPVRSGAVVGTGSARRRAQLLDRRPDLAVTGLRGNVPTRIQKLAAGDFDAIVLAEAGLQRLAPRLEPLRLFVWPLEEFLPAPAQGALAIQMRGGQARLSQDDALAAAVQRVHHVPTDRLVRAERALLRSLAGGCNLPLGTVAEPDGDWIRLRAVLGEEVGDTVRLRRCDVKAAGAEAAAREAHRRLTEPDPG
jgi:hydroxymethylbilane synthase